MIPAGIIGLTMDDLIDSITQSNNQYYGLLIVGACLLFTAALLFFTEKSKSQIKEVTPKSAFIIGIAQAIALLPGISRSGSTIATGILLGVNREKMARFSFLMVLPLIVGAMLKKGKDYMDQGGESTMEILPLIVGFVVAFFTGLVACKWMIALVKKAKLTYFAIYCAAAGLVAITYSVFFL